MRRVQTPVMRKMLLMVSLLTLAGCGPALQWHKPNTSAEAVQLDAKECRVAARDEAFRENFLYGPPFYSFPSYGPRGLRHWRDPFYDPFFAREMREQSLQDFCLRARGYQLVPMSKQPEPQQGAPS